MNNFRTNALLVNESIKRLSRKVGDEKATAHDFTLVLTGIIALQTETYAECVSAIDDALRSVRAAERLHFVDPQKAAWFDLCGALLDQAHVNLRVAMAAEDVLSAHEAGAA